MCVAVRSRAPFSFLETLSTGSYGVLKKLRSGMRISIYGKITPLLASYASMWPMDDKLPEFGWVDRQRTNYAIFLFLFLVEALLNKDNCVVVNLAAID